MDIREFYKSTQEKQNQSTNSNSSSNHSASGNSNQDFSEYQDTINKYKNLSQNQLYDELLKQAGDLKSQGKLDSNMLNQLSTTLQPMLNDEQKQLLSNILQKLQ